MHSNSKSLNIGSFQNTSKSLERGGLAHKTRKTTRERLTVYITDIFPNEYTAVDITRTSAS